MLETQAFIGNCDAELLAKIPAVFKRQAEAGNPVFVLTQDYFSHLRIVFDDLEATEDGITAKLRFQARIDERGELEELLAGKADNEKTKWLKGFRSQRLLFNEEAIEAGLITKSGLDALTKHAAVWAERGNDSMYKDYPNYRLFLTPENANAKFIFQMEERANPTTGEITIGIAEPFWRAFKIIGNNVNTVSSFGKYSLEAVNTKVTPITPAPTAGTQGNRTRSRNVPF